MGSVGIIAEYNPFHNGHSYHLKKIKEMFPDDVIVLVMSSSFSQRGEPSIIDKWKKRDIALSMGVDLIVELPFAFATQSADFFAHGAISILENLKVEKLVFGSETNDVNKLILLAKTELNNEDFDKLVKIYLKLGENYPTALSKALLDLTGNNVVLPNDLLGISYVKEILKNNYFIKPICIKRTSIYHSQNTLDSITSASAIRNALLFDKDISKNVPLEVLKVLKNCKKHFQEDYFKFLKYKIMVSKDLSIYQTVDEGIGEKISKEIYNCCSYEELIKKVKSKRYTYNKINRMLTHILCDFTKEDALSMKDIEYIRLLGFNFLGRKYLNNIKKEVSIPIISKFSKNKPKMLELEYKATCVYASILDEKEKVDLIKKEYQNNLGNGGNYDKD